MSKPIVTADSTVNDVLYELDVRGLALLQPMQGIEKNGRLWVIVNLQEVASRRVFVGEGPHVWDAVNAAYEKASATGLRNSRLS